ncbi:HAD hydrolase-like protein [Terrabacter aeriphilus]|uniref:HAD hydrolase-like protein n=1 Tax=Terrabacter aeriphilus TaxID=515662 RepID=A0ABP9IZG1_9MICO
MLTAYDGVVCDLDGVVYRGDDAVPGAPEALQRMAAHGTGLVYATNNASRVPAEVAAHLASLGAPAEPADVVTSAEAGAERLAGLVPTGSGVLALGGPGVVEALTRSGLRPVAPPDAVDGAAVEVAAVLQGFGRELTVRDFETAARLLASGLPWVATNDDATLPLPWGQSPGNGAYVVLLATATGRRPEVVGKPHPPLYRLALNRLSTAPERTLAVGDRLDTDVAGALATGIDSAWVLTGVDRPSDLLARSLRPTYVIDSLAQLFEPYAVAWADAGGWRCGDARVHLADGDLVVDEVGASPVEAVRAGIAAFDGTRQAASDGRTGAVPDGRRVGTALDELLTAPAR